MRRRIFTFASLLSLLLCLASVVLWVRSEFASDSLWTLVFNSSNGVTGNVVPS